MGTVTNDTARVAICVVTHNCVADIADFFSAVESLEHPGLELVIIDSASRDGTVSRINALDVSLPMTLEALPENVGYAAGMNCALTKTQAPWILALNADTRPEPDFVTALLHGATTDASLKVAAVSGRLTRLADPDRLDAAGMRLTIGWRHLDRGSGERDEGQFGETERVFGATGAAVLLRREALDDVTIDGMAYAEEFHSFREDAELAFRLRERGWEVLYEPTARAHHRRFSTPRRRRDLPEAVNRHSLKNRYLLRAYHQSAGNFLTTLIPTLVRDAAALTWVLLFERSSLAAYGWLWRHRSEILAKRRQIRARRSEPQRHVNRWFWRHRRPL